ncbi:tRNA (uracil-5-)-methyltransferase-like A [Silurus meridionalis]|nr:tRNA (uracil-5-)-methyltransferase-like A [Silurus meridionalis]
MHGVTDDDDDDDDGAVGVIRTSAGTEDLPCELVTGDAWIHEELLGLRFQISPHSFFQVALLSRFCHIHFRRNMALKLLIQMMTLCGRAALRVRLLPK